MEKHTKSSFDNFIIQKIKEKRSKNGLSQFDLAVKLGVSPGFIGKIESPNTNAKYNLNHLNKLALVFNCSPRDFLPKNPIV